MPYESPGAFSPGNASIGANGAIISPARLDRSWLSNCLSEAGLNVFEKTARFASPSSVTANCSAASAWSAIAEEKFAFGRSLDVSRKWAAAKKFGALPVI
jgi:hypothetical protein